MADFYWTGTGSGLFSDLATWMGPGAVSVSTLPGVGDNVYIGDPSSLPGLGDNNTLTVDVPFSIENLYIMGENSDVSGTPYSAPLSMDFNMVIDFAATLTCINAEILTGVNQVGDAKFGSPIGANDATFVTFTSSGGALQATGRTVICGGTFAAGITTKDLLLTNGALMSNSLAYSFLPNGNITLMGGSAASPGILCINLFGPDLQMQNINIFGETALDFNGTLCTAFAGTTTKTYSFRAILMQTFIQAADTSVLGSTVGVFQKCIFTAQSSFVQDAVVTTNHFKISAQSVNKLGDLIFNQIAGDYSATFELLSGGLGLCSGHFKGFGDLNVLPIANMLFLGSTSGPHEVGTLQAFDAQLDMGGEIHSNGGTQGLFSYITNGPPATFQTAIVTIDPTFGTGSSLPTLTVQMLCSTDTNAHPSSFTCNAGTYGLRMAQQNNFGAASFLNTGDLFAVGVGVQLNVRTLSVGADFNFANDTFNIKPPLTNATIFTATGANSNLGSLNIEPLANSTYTLDGGSTGVASNLIPAIDIFGNTADVTFILKDMNISALTFNHSPTVANENIFQINGTTYLHGQISVVGIVPSNSTHTRWRFLMETTHKLVLCGEPFGIPDNGCITLDCAGTGQNLVVRNVGDTAYDDLHFGIGNEPTNTHNILRLSSSNTNTICTESKGFEFRSGSKIEQTATSGNNLKMKLIDTTNGTPADSSARHSVKHIGAVVHSLQTDRHCAFLSVESTGYTSFLLPPSASTAFPGILVDNGLYIDEGDNTVGVHLFGGFNMRQIGQNYINYVDNGNLSLLGYTVEHIPSGDGRDSLRLGGIVNVIAGSSSSDMLIVTNVQAGTGSATTNIANVPAPIGPQLAFSTTGTATTHTITGNYQTDNLELRGNGNHIFNVASPTSFTITNELKASQTCSVTTSPNLVFAMTGASGKIDVTNTGAWVGEQMILIDASAVILYNWITTAATQDACNLQMVAGAVVRLNNADVLAGRLSGTGTFDFRGAVAAPTPVQLTLIARSGTYDTSTITYANADANTTLRLDRKAAEVGNTSLGNTSYSMMVETNNGFAGADFFVYLPSSVSFNGGLRLNADNDTPGGSFMGAMRGTTSTVQIQSGEFKVGYGTNLIAQDIILLDIPSGLHNPLTPVGPGVPTVHGTNSLLLRYTGQNFQLSGQPRLKSGNLTVRGNSSSAFTMNLLGGQLIAHDGGNPDTLTIGFDTGFASDSDVNLFCQTIEANQINIGSNSVVTVNGSTTFISGTTAVNKILDRNTTPQTYNGVTFYGTSSFGSVIVNADTQIDVSGGAKGFICSDMTITSGTFSSTGEANLVTLRVTGNTSKTVEIQNGGSLVLPNGVATETTDGANILLTSSNTHPAIDLKIGGTLELGDTQDSPRTNFTSVGTTTASHIVVEGTSTLKLRNVVATTTTASPGDYLVSANGGTPTVEIRGLYAMLDCGGARVRRTASGYFENSYLTTSSTIGAIVFGDNDTATSQSGNFAIEQNYFESTATSGELVKFLGKPTAVLHTRNYLKSTSTLTYGLHIDSAVAVTDEFDAFTSWIFALNGATIPVKCNQDFHSYQFYFPASTSNLGSADTTKHMYYNANGFANNADHYYGGAVSGNVISPVMRADPVMDTGGSGSTLITFTRSDEKTFLTGFLTSGAAGVFTEIFPYKGGDSIKVEWDELDAANPMVISIRWQRRRGAMATYEISNGGTLTSDNTATGFQVRGMYSNTLAGFTNLRITNATTGDLLYREQFQYQPVISDNDDSLVIAANGPGYSGNRPAQSTSELPVESIPEYANPTNPVKPRYIIGLDRTEIINGNQYSIMFGKTDPANFYIARFTVTNSASPIQVTCQLFKTVSGVTTQEGTDSVVTVDVTAFSYAQLGVTWTPGTSVQWYIDGTPGATISTLAHTGGSFGFQSAANKNMKILAAYETDGLTLRNTDVSFQSNVAWSSIGTGGVDLLNCTVNKNIAAAFPTYITDTNSFTLVNTTFADQSLPNVINRFIELKGVTINLDGDLLLGEQGKLHLYGCIVKRTDGGRWSIDTRGIAYTDTPPVKLSSNQLRGLYTTILRNGELIKVDDETFNSYMIRIYARKEMRVKRNNVLGLDFNRNVTNGFNNFEQDCTMLVHDNIYIPGRLDEYWRGEEVFEFITPYCFIWKGKITAYRTSIKTSDNTTTEVRFTVEEWRDD